MKIAVIDKSYNNTRYEKHFELQDHDVHVYHMSSEKITGRLLKKHIDLGTETNPFNVDDFDYTILVGAEPFLAYAGKKGIQDYSGKRVEHNGYSNFIASISPAQTHFKPEMKPVFENTVASIHTIINGMEKFAKVGNYKPIVDSEEAENYIKAVYLMKGGAVSLDSETSALYVRDGYLLGVSISHEEYQGVYIDADCITETFIEYLQKVLDTPERPIVLHNTKFDVHFYSYHLGVSFKSAAENNRLHDTMLEHYVLDERRGTHGLKSLAMKYTDMGDYDFELDLFKDNYCKAHGIKKEDFSYDLIPFDIMWPYAAKDTDATLRLHNFFYPKICNNPKLHSLYHEVLMPGCVFLQRVEDRGIPLSKDRLKEAQIQLTNNLNKYREELYKYPEVKELEDAQGSMFNPNSVMQLRKLLFDFIGLEPTGMLTDTGADSTNAEALGELAHQHPIAKTLLNIRKTTKLISTYVEKLLVNIDLDGRIRTGFHEHMTTSGRLSSSGKFNAQQLPRDESIIKGCVVAPFGYKIVAWDLTTAEVYYAAVLSKDRNMQQVFINMKNDPDKYPDFHSNIAHMVFKLSCEPKEVKELYPALRQASKAITFGILFGSGPAKVAQSVNEAQAEQAEKLGLPFEECTVADAKGYIETYFRMFPQLKKWIDSCHDQIKNYGYIYSHFGRKRRLLNINSDDRGVQGEELRSGFNSIIQSASSDSLLLGAIDTDNEIISKGLENEMQIIMLVHDSVVALVREDLVDEYNEILIRNVQKDRGVSIPGYPIGIESDSEAGGSVDYSCGKMKKQHPSISTIEDPAFEKYVRDLIDIEGLSYIQNEAKNMSKDEEKIAPKYAKDISKDFDNIARVLNIAA